MPTLPCRICPERNRTQCPKVNPVNLDPTNNPVLQQLCQDLADTLVLARLTKGQADLVMLAIEHWTNGIVEETARQIKETVLGDYQ